MAIQDKEDIPIIENSFSIDEKNCVVSSKTDNSENSNGVVSSSLIKDSEDKKVICDYKLLGAKNNQDKLNSDLSDNIHEQRPYEPSLNETNAVDIPKGDAIITNPFFDTSIVLTEIEDDNNCLETHFTFEDRKATKIEATDATNIVHSVNEVNDTTLNVTSVEAQLTLDDIDIDLHKFFNVIEREDYKKVFNPFDQQFSAHNRLEDKSTITSQSQIEETNAADKEESSEKQAIPEKSSISKLALRLQNISIPGVLNVPSSDTTGKQESAKETNPTTNLGEATNNTSSPGTKRSFGRFANLKNLGNRWKNQVINNGDDLTNNSAKSIPSIDEALLGNFCIHDI